MTLAVSCNNSYSSTVAERSNNCCYRCNLYLSSWHLLSMSHASRWRSKSNTQVKTHHLQDCNGWTHVIRGPLQTSRLLISQSPYAAVHVGKVEIPDGFTLEDAQNAHIRFTERWESSKCFKWLVNLFEQTILNLERLRIDSCVVTGLGSFTKNEATGNNSSFYQLAAFETMLRLMSEIHHLTFMSRLWWMLERRFRINQVYFQEPIFTKLDEDLLTSKGFTVVQDPEATDLVTESTFLYAPCNEWSTIYTILERTHPALYVGNELILSCNHHGFG